MFGFGEWTVEVDGVRANELRSRAARELLLRMSLAPGPVSRERLIDDLWPDQVDVRRGRRRLSQELSRVQKGLGVALWTSDVDSVEVSSTCRLWSDLAEFSRESQPDRAVVTGDADWKHLADVLRLPQRGVLLPGHMSTWASTRRNQADRDEVKLLRQGLVALPETDWATRLSYAQRWARLEPFGDDAHAAVVRSLRMECGPAAANSYIQKVTERYRRELGCDPGAVVEEALSEPLAQTRPPLWIEINELRERCQQAVADGSDPRPLLVAIDDRLRIAGHHRKRAPGLVELRHLGHDPVDIAWRELEIATTENNASRAREVIESHPTLDGAVGPEAMFVLARGQYAERVGDRDRALADVQPLTASPDPVVRIEANLALGWLLDFNHDFPGAERALLQACADADELGCRYSRARALCTLGWIQTRTGDHARARQNLALGQQEATDLGAESVLALAHGGTGHLLGREHRFGSSIVELAEAAAICERIGDVPNAMRWHTNAASMAVMIGDASMAERCLNAVRESCAHHPEASPYWLDIIDQDLIEIQGRPDEASDLTMASIEKSSVNGSLGYLLSAQANQVQRLINLNRTEEAIAMASSMIDTVAEHKQADIWGHVAHAALGCALTAAGEATKGILHLRQATSAKLMGFINPCELYYWHYTAATTLGEHREAREMAVNAELYAAALKSDLTAEQWEQALAKAPGLARLTKLYETSPSEPLHA